VSLGKTGEIKVRVLLGAGLCKREGASDGLGLVDDGLFLEAVCGGKGGLCSLYRPAASFASGPQDAAMERAEEAEAQAKNKKKNSIPK